MSSLSSDTLINPQDLFDITVTTAQTNLGGLATTGDGRYYRYALAGGVALVPGTLQQSIVEVTANENLAVAAAALGATQIVTTTTVTVAANLYAGGYAMVTVTPGQGSMYQIAGHAATTAAAVTLNLVDPIVGTALTTASRIDLVQNLYSSVIQSPITTRTGVVVGVAVAATPTLYYGWLAVRGVSNVLAAGTVVVGEQVGQATAVAGACTATTGVLADIGYAVTGIADTEYGAIALNIS